MDNNIPIKRNGISKLAPKLASRISHKLLKIKTDATTRINSQII